MGRLIGLVARNRLFSALLAVAAALRVVTMLGFPPALWFDDSFDYLGIARRLQPYPIRPDGYPFLLRVLQPLHSFAAVTAVQHLMGLATGIMIYALLRRRGLQAWGAALAALPVLFDVLQLLLEQSILSDVAFTFYTTAAVVVLLWHDRPTVRAGLAAGLLLAAALLTRSAGLPLLLVVAVGLLCRWPRSGRAGRRAGAALAAACGLPLAGYAVWFASWHGTYGLTSGSGVWLWSRTMSFADCAKIEPPPEELSLCPTQPRGQRPAPPDYVWADWSPLARQPGHPATSRIDRFAPETQDRAGRFAFRAIRAQPVDYLLLSGGDLARSFNVLRYRPPGDVFYNQYSFPNAEGPLPKGTRIPGGSIAADVRGYEGEPVRIRPAEPYAGVMRAYQWFGYLPGAGLGVILIVGGARVCKSWRQRGGPALLPWATAMVLLVVPPFVSAYGVRYVLAAAPLACLAAALSGRTSRPTATDLTGAGPATTGPSGSGPTATRAADRVAVPQGEQRTRERDAATRPVGSPA